jgi:hypothetical protein
MDVTPQPKVHDDKSTKRFEESIELKDVKPAALENADYTGAEAKTDPAEIALVRKIDWRLMVRVTGTRAFIAGRLTKFSLHYARCTS